MPVRDPTLVLQTLQQTRHPPQPDILCMCPGLSSLYTSRVIQGVNMCALPACPPLRMRRALEHLHTIPHALQNFHQL